MRCVFFFQAEDGIRDADVTGVQTCALPISKPARGSLNRSREKTGGTRNRITGCQRSFGLHKLGDRHGRKRSEVMWIQNFKERFRNLREFVINFEANPTRKKSKGFDETLNVRVFTLIRLQLQSCRNLRILLGKLRTHLAEEDQLTLIISEQVVTHIVVSDRVPWSRNTWFKS